MSQNFLTIIFNYKLLIRFIVFLNLRFLSPFLLVFRVAPRMGNIIFLLAQFLFGPFLIIVNFETNKVGRFRFRVIFIQCYSWEI